MPYPAQSFFIISLLIATGTIQAAEEPLELVISSTESPPTAVDKEKLNEIRSRKANLIGRSRIVQLDPSALITDHRQSVSEEGPNFDWCIGEKATLTLFGDETIVVQNLYVDEHEPGPGESDFWTWAGQVDGDDSSAVVFTVVDGEIISGLISSTIVGEYRIELISDNYYLVYQRMRDFRNDVDKQILKEIGDDFIRVEDLELDQSGENNSPSASTYSSSSFFVDVGGFATGNYPGGAFDARNNLTEGITRFNIALAHGGSFFTLKFKSPVYDIFTVDEMLSGGGMSIERLLLRIGDDGHEAVTSIRNLLAADVFVGFGDRDQGDCGQAYVPVSA